jgi:hypothetical protein
MSYRETVPLWCCILFGVLLENFFLNQRCSLYVVRHHVHILSKSLDDGLTGPKCVGN